MPASNRGIAGAVLRLFLSRTHLMSCSACSTGIIGALVISRSTLAALYRYNPRSEGMSKRYKLLNWLLLNLLNLLPLLNHVVYLQSSKPVQFAVVLRHLLNVLMSRLSTYPVVPVSHHSSTNSEDSHSRRTCARKPPVYSDRGKTAWRWHVLHDGHVLSGLQTKCEYVSRENDRPYCSMRSSNEPSCPGSHAEGSPSFHAIYVYK